MIREPPVEAVTRLGARGDLERCRRASRAAGARRSAFEAHATRSCSATANVGRAPTYARHDRDSPREFRCGRALKGSAEGSRSRACPTSQRPHAPAPYGVLARLLPSTPPSHVRILADRLRVTCISTSLPPPSARWPVRQSGKRGSGSVMVAARPGLDARRTTQHGAHTSRLWWLSALVVLWPLRLRTFLFVCRTEPSAAGSSFGLSCPDRNEGAAHVCDHSPL